MNRNLYSRWAIPMAVVLILAVALLLALPRVQKKAPVEVSRSELVQRDGAWYRQAEATPFTGVMIETYETGERKSRSQIVQGRLQGISERWYTNGQPQHLEHFVSGISHGVRTKWHPNGTRLSEVQIVQGKLEGTFRRWYDDGRLHQEIQLVNGKPDGVSRAYYPSGFLSAEARMRDGEMLEQKFWKDGEKPGAPLVSVAGQ